MSAFVMPPHLREACPDFGRDLVARLELAIGASGLARGRFAAEAGISLATLNDLRRHDGRSLPTLGTVASICLAHDISLAWLVFGQGQDRAAMAEPCPVCVPRFEGTA